MKKSELKSIIREIIEESKIIEESSFGNYTKAEIDAKYSSISRSGSELQGTLDGLRRAFKSSVTYLSWTADKLALYDVHVYSMPVSQVIEILKEAVESYELDSYVLGYVSDGCELFPGAAEAYEDEAIEESNDSIDVGSVINVILRSGDDAAEEIEFILDREGTDVNNMSSRVKQSIKDMLEQDFPDEWEIAVNEISEPIEESNDQSFNYRLLSRLQSDCDYYLGAGNRSARSLWAGNEIEQIEKMVELYNSLSDKPEWITMDDIEGYKKQMIPTSAKPYVQIEESVDTEIVVFRKFDDGDVIALFPNADSSSPTMIGSYMHIGQHSEASLDLLTDLLTELEPATPDEYAELLKELKSIYENGPDDMVQLIVEESDISSGYHAFAQDALGDDYDEIDIDNELYDAGVYDETEDNTEYPNEAKLNTDDITSAIDLKEANSPFRRDLRNKFGDLRDDDIYYVPAKDMYIFSLGCHSESLFVYDTKWNPSPDLVKFFASRGYTIKTAGYLAGYQGYAAVK